MRERKVQEKKQERKVLERYERGRRGSKGMEEEGANTEDEGEAGKKCLWGVT